MDPPSVNSRKAAQLDIEFHFLIMEQGKHFFFFFFTGRHFKTNNRLEKKKKRQTLFPLSSSLKGQCGVEERSSSTLCLCLAQTHTHTHTLYTHTHTHTYTQLAVVGGDWGAVRRVGLSVTRQRPVLQAVRQWREC